jgi:RNA polymerase primary sigma factor
MCRPLLDSSEATVKELIRNAKKRGCVTVEQVSSALPRRRAIRSRSRIFGEMGVNVVETQEVLLRDIIDLSCRP